MPRRNISFQTIDSVTLRGWLYTPSSFSSSNLPCLVMAHGWSCLKEMELPRLAEYFISKLSIAVLIYDHRGFGASDQKEGQPLREIVPAEQVSDFSDAVTYVSGLDEVDAERVGIWGYSYAGGHVLAVAAGDARVKAVIAVAPVVSSIQGFHRRVRPDFKEEVLKAFAADRQSRARGEEVVRVPIISENPMGVATLPTATAYKWFSEWEKKSDWKNDLTLRSSYASLNYEPGALIHCISPRPLLMVVAEKDAEAPADLALEAYSRAREPKQLQMLGGGHFDVFGTENFEKMAAAQVRFLKNTLCSDDVSVRVGALSV